jgi:hypothetical protein
MISTSDVKQSMVAMIMCATALLMAVPVSAGSAEKADGVTRSAVVSPRGFSTVEGKNAAFAAGVGTLDSAGDIAPLSVAIKKGKRGRAIAISATVQVQNLSGTIPGVYVRALVNDIDLRPVSASSFDPWISTACGTGSSCAVTGTFWIDLDDVESAFPGSFINRPLDITVRGGDWEFGGEGTSYMASISAQLVRK